MRLTRHKTFFALLLLLALVASPAAQAAGKPLRGVVRMMDANRNERAQLQAVMDAYFKALQSLTGYDMSMRYLDGPLQPVLTKERPDFFFSTDYHESMQAIKSGYVPSMRFSVMGDDMVRYCLFVQKRALITSPADLKGKRLTSAPELLTYLKLREILGRAPMGFFSQMKSLQASGAAFTSLAAGQTDAVMAGSITYHLLQTARPPWMDEVRPLVCKDAFASPPISIRKDIPVKVMNDVKQGLAAARNHPAIRPILPLLNRIKGEVIPTSAKDYDDFVKYIQAKQAQGWLKEFEAFKLALKP